VEQVSQGGHDSGRYQHGAGNVEGDGVALGDIEDEPGQRGTNRGGNASK